MELHKKYTNNSDELTIINEYRLDKMSEITPAYLPITPDEVPQFFLLIFKGRVQLLHLVQEIELLRFQPPFVRLQC